MQTRWHELKRTEFERSTVTSCTGGATWIRAGFDYYVVPGKSTVDIARFYRNNPDGTIPAQLNPCWREYSL
jgi:hypothetical protein